jgi:hypothetical protein
MRPPTRWKNKHSNGCKERNCEPQDIKSNSNAESTRMYPYLLLLQSIFSFTCILSCVCCGMCAARTAYQSF